MPKRAKWPAPTINLGVFYLLTAKLTRLYRIAILYFYDGEFFYFKVCIDNWYL